MRAGRGLGENRDRDRADPEPRVGVGTGDKWVCIKSRDALALILRRPCVDGYIGCSPVSFTVELQYQQAALAVLTSLDGVKFCSNEVLYRSLGMRLRSRRVCVHDRAEDVKSGNLS